MYQCCKFNSIWGPAWYNPNTSRVWLWEAFLWASAPLCIVRFCAIKVLNLLVAFLVWDTWRCSCLFADFDASGHTDANVMVTVMQKSKAYHTMHGTIASIQILQTTHGHPWTNCRCFYHIAPTYPNSKGQCRTSPEMRSLVCQPLQAISSQYWGSFAPRRVHPRRIGWMSTGFLDVLSTGWEGWGELCQHVHGNVTMLFSVVLS